MLIQLGNLFAQYHVINRSINNYQNFCQVITYTAENDEVDRTQPQTTLSNLNYH